MRRTRTTTLPALAGVGILTLAACGATGEGAGTDDPTATAPETTESASPSPTEDDDDATASGGADCVEGEWDGDPEAAERQAVASLELGDYEIDPSVSVSGATVVEFDGSTMTHEFEDQVSEIVLLVEGQEVMATLRLDGTLEGEYTIDGDTLSVTDVDVSGLESEVTAELAGAEYDLPGVEALGADRYAADQEFTFECTEDELRLTPVASAMDDSEELDDLTHVLTRR